MGPDTSLDRTGDMLAAMGSLDIRPSAEAPIRFPMFTIQENVAIHGEKIRSPYRLLYASTRSTKIVYHLAGQIASFFLSVSEFRPFIYHLHLQNLISLPVIFQDLHQLRQCHHLFFKYEFLNGCHGIRRIGNSLGFQPQG